MGKQSPGLGAGSESHLHLPQAGGLSQSLLLPELGKVRKLGNDNSNN